MKTFLSIGAGPGIGLATAERFAREGFRVVLSARNETKTKELAGQLEAKGHKVEVRTVDAAEPSSVAALVSRLKARSAGSMFCTSMRRRCERPRWRINRARRSTMISP